MAAEHQNLPCPNWIVSHGNAHICNDRARFTEDTPFETLIDHGLRSPRVRVDGVGTVEVVVKDGSRFRLNHKAIRLENVLYAPGYKCNVFATRTPNLLRRGATVRNFPGGQRHLCERDGNVDTRFTGASPPGLPSTRWFFLDTACDGSKPGRDPSVFEHYRLVTTTYPSWNRAERKRWEALPSPAEPDTSSVSCSLTAEPVTNSVSSSPTTVRADTSVSPASEDYTDEEREWLKEHWGSECRFFQAYGKNIHKDSDVEEGRELIRSIFADVCKVREEKRKVERMRAASSYWARRLPAG